MTHFPNYNADEVRAKLAQFKESSTWLMQQANLKREEITLHVANSYTALNVPEAQLDMVRPGGVLFGDLPTNPEYPSIVSFKTRVSSLHHLPKDSTVVMTVLLLPAVTVCWRTCLWVILMVTRAKWAIKPKC